jgi:transketolase
MNLDVCIVALGAGFSYGTAGYSHHLIEDISALSALPNMSIYSPADTLEVELLFPKILKKNGPRYVRLGKGGEGRITEKFIQVDSGISIMAGSCELVILTTGNILGEVLYAVNRFPAEVRPTILSVSDFDSLRSFLSKAEYRRIITVEEHVLRGGLGSIVLELTSVSNCSVRRIGILKISSEISGSQKFLRQHYMIDESSLYEVIQQEIAIS